jgi:lambda repressor-like predicted transcriptional regulator
VPVDPSLRKVQALARLGHTRASVAAEMGVSPSSLTNTLKREMIKGRTEVIIEEVFQRLQMVVPPDTPITRRTRREAERAGWLPPLAYDDIHNNVVAKVPSGSGFSRKRLDLDLVDYVMQCHDFSVRLSPIEKAHVVRRWVRNGRSERSLCQITGWREGRYRLNEA